MRYVLFLPLLLAYCSPIFAIGEVIVYEENAPRDKAVNVVIVSEGYTVSEKSKFGSHLKNFADAIFSDPSLASYRSYFNIYGVFVPSNESGADDPLGGVYRDTYFNAKYNTNNIDRLLTADATEAKNIVNGLIPEQDIVCISVNYDKYGGSGGSIAVANYSSPEIVAHEIGHSFVGLKDEYGYTDGYTAREGINATAKTFYNDIRWNYWIDQSTPLPTPDTSTYNNVVGIFEGANYNATGWYRPERNCRMRSNGVDLCAVCSEAWILQIYEIVSPLDSVFPNPGVTVNLDGTNELRVVPKEPTDSTIIVEWYMDGSKLNHSGNTLDMITETGSHSIKAVITDTVSRVRNDPSSLLKDSVSWDVFVDNVTAISDLSITSKVNKSLAIIGVSNNRVNLSVPSVGIYEVNIYSINGRLIHSVTSNLTMGVNSLSFKDNGIASSGMVIVQINGKETSLTKKAIVK